MSGAKQPSVKAIFFCLFLVYITWGSTYIGYKLTLQVVGPFIAAGSRSIIGGTLLALYLMYKQEWKKTTLHTLWIIVWLSIPMHVFASGFLGLGQTQIPSCVAAIISGSTPIIMLLAGYLFAGESKPLPVQCIGLCLGAAGIVYLGYSQSSGAVGAHPVLGALAVLCANFGWVSGSLIVKKNPFRQRVPILETTSLVLVIGGIECLLLAFILGEHHAMHWENLRPAVVVAFSWMCIGGSLIAYASYMWLLANAPLSVAVSYEYVLPVIGIFLGWLIGGEAIALSTLATCATTILSVALIIVPMTSKSQATRQAAKACPNGAAPPTKPASKAPKQSRRSK